MKQRGSVPHLPIRGCCPHPSNHSKRRFYASPRFNQYNPYEFSIARHSRIDFRIRYGTGKSVVDLGINSGCDAEINSFSNCAVAFAGNSAKGSSGILRTAAAHWRTPEPASRSSSPEPRELLSIPADYPRISSITPAKRLACSAILA